MSKNNYALVNGKLVTPTSVIECGTLLVEDGTISEALTEHAKFPSAGFEILDCAGRIVMPGFIDLHTHGGRGHDFVDTDDNTCAQLSEYYFSHGVTTLLATLSPLSHSLLLPAVQRMAKFLESHKTVTNIIGIHLEGPYINRAMTGGNQEKYIEAPNFEEWQKVAAAGKGHIKLMTVAPELPGIDPIIDHAIKNGIAISVGHSKANGDIMARMIERGVTQVTHLFNSMPPLHHREVGILTEALLSDCVDAQLIADGIHVNAKTFRLAVKLKSPDHILVITDSIRATEKGDGKYTSAGREVVVKEGVVRADDGTLAGSTLVMEDALRFLTTAARINLPDASKMMSLNAARALGIDKETGSITKGKKADIVVVDDRFRVTLTMAAGILRYRS
ncbi:MAG TPA: N-acetylglucosamine-6-phosphate deacetylase [Candidatus Kryptonia bacterium]